MAPERKESAVRTTLAIGVAGALGAVSRHQLESLVNRLWGDVFPWGTFAVNVSGSFALGVLVGVFATVGFLGAYTTFSTVSLQVYRSESTGHVLVGVANAAGSMLAGALAVYAGILLVRII
jgi:fluoride exporter